MMNDEDDEVLLDFLLRFVTLDGPEKTACCVAARIADDSRPFELFFLSSLSSTTKRFSAFIFRCRKTFSAFVELSRRREDSKIDGDASTADSPSNWLSELSLTIINSCCLKPFGLIESHARLKNDAEFFGESRDQEDNACSPGEADDLEPLIRRLAELTVDCFSILSLDSKLEFFSPLTRCFAATAPPPSDAFLSFVRHVWSLDSSRRSIPDKVVAAIFDGALDHLKNIEIESGTEEKILALTSSIVVGDLDVAVESKNDAAFAVKLSSVWNVILELSRSSEGHPRYGFKTETALGVACLVWRHALASRLPHSTEFWNLILTGLTHSRSSARKRGRYLLAKTLEVMSASESRVIDGGNVRFRLPADPASRSAWLRFGHLLSALFEVLEEKQLHVIKPVLPRFDDVVSFATAESADGVWIRAILRRGFAHESRSVARWALTTALSLPRRHDGAAGNLISTPDAASFLADDLLSALNRENSFSRWGCEEDDALESFAPGERPPVAAALAEFVTAMAKRPEFLFRFLEAVKSLRWGQIQLVYVAEALSEIPQFRSCGAEVIEAVRDIVAQNVAFYSPACQRPIKAFFVEMLDKAVDLSLISPSIVFKLMDHMLRREEDVQNATYLKTRFFLWLLKDNESSVEENASTNSLDSFVTRSVAQLDEVEIEELDRDSARLIVEWFVFTAALAERSDSSLEREKITGWGIEKMKKWTEAAAEAFRRPYLSEDKVFGSLSVVSAFSEFLKRDASQNAEIFLPHKLMNYFYNDLFKPMAVNFIHFILRRFREFLSCVDTVRLSELVLYRRIADQLILGADSESRGALDAMRYLGCELLASPKSSMDALVGVSAVNFWSIIYENQRESNSLMERMVLKPQVLLLSPLDCPMGLANEKWTPLRVFHLGNVWSILRRRKELFDDERAREDCELILQVADLVKLDSCRDLFRRLGKIASRLPLPDDDLVERCFSKMLSLLEEFYNEDGFWSLYETFVDVVFDPDFLLSNDECVDRKLREMVAKIFSLSDSRVGLAPVLAKKLFATWSYALESRPEEAWRSLIHWADVVRDLLLFGPVHHKFTRNLTDTVKYLGGIRTADGRSNFVSIMNGLPLSHSSVRMHAVVFLVKLIRRFLKDGYIHETSSSNYLDFFRLLNEILLSSDASDGNRRGAHYANSFLHRRNHRAWQSLTLTQTALLRDGSTQQRLLNHCLSALGVNLPVSVRFMIEWMIARILCDRLKCLGENNLAKDVNSLDEDLAPLVSAFRSLPTKRVGSLSSLLDVIVMIIVGADSISPSTEGLFVRLADILFPLIVPLTTSQHFMTRAYAISALAVVWPIVALRLSAEESARFRILDAVVAFNADRGDGLKKSSHFVEDLFVFRGFRPLEDLTLETLFQTLPRIADVTDEEWIRVEEFRAAEESMGGDEKGSMSQSFFPISDPETVIVACESLRLKRLPRALDDFDNDDEGGVFNVQKKITPTSSPLVAGLEQDAGSKRKAEVNVEDCGLVLVATLLDKIPNLGGLCRTAEIFGVVELVVSNRKILDNKEFQNLSVTSEKWLRVTEVSVKDLWDYLEILKLKRGFKIVALEQSERSVPLSTYSLPRKMALLLGNERLGVPAKMLAAGNALIDACVEIPQCGVVRSLNVHVSGAILMWEYAKQHLIDK